MPRQPEDPVLTRFRVAQKFEALRQYKAACRDPNITHPKAHIVKLIQDKYGRKSFGRQSLNYWIKTEDSIRRSAGMPPPQSPSLVQTNTKTKKRKEPAAPKQRQLMLSDFTIAQKLNALDQYHSACKDPTIEHPKAHVVQLIRTKYARRTFHRQTLNYWIKTEPLIRKATGRKSERKHAYATKREGAYPEMEHRLHAWIVDLRTSGVPVEHYMIVRQGRTILKDLYPHLYANENAHGPDFVEPFSFSVGWQSGFFGRYKLSARKLTTISEKTADGFFFRPTLSLDCAQCMSGPANKRCVGMLCKKCCAVNQDIRQCLIHRKKST